MHASWKVMDSKIEQSLVIKFLINSGEKTTEIFLKLKKVFRYECASRARIFEWACQFKEGRRSVYNNERSGMPVRMQRSQMKAMLVCFFYVHGIVHHEFVPPHQTVMTKFYLEVLGRLQEQITRMCIMTMHRHIHLSRYANIWWKKYSHVATPTLQPRPRPCDFFLFTKLK